MICLCSLRLAQLGPALASLSASAALTASLSAQLPRLQLAANLALLPQLPHLPALNVNLPAISLGSGAAAALQSSAAALASVRAALGINLLDAHASLALNELAASVTANAAALRLPSLSLSALASLTAAASAVLAARLSLGLNLLDAKAVASFVTGLPAPAAMATSTIGPLLMARLNAVIGLALAVKAAQLSFGINLGDPAGPSQLAAALQAMASLQLPALAISLPRLNLVLAAAQAVLTVKAAFGLDLGSPAAAGPLAQLMLQLSGLRLPALPLPVINLSGLKLALGLDLQPLLNIDLSPLSLALGSMPSFQGLSMIASLTASVRAAFGLNLLAHVGCGPQCPLA